jgi:hypothetical protein
VDVGYVFGYLGGFLAHYLGDLSHDGSTAGGAFVDRFAFIDDGVCITGTTGIAAAATVCARQDFVDLFHTGVNFHGKDLGSDGQKHTEDEAQDADNESGDADLSGERSFSKSDKNYVHDYILRV